MRHTADLRIHIIHEEKDMLASVYWTLRDTLCYEQVVAHASVADFLSHMVQHKADRICDVIMLSDYHFTALSQTESVAQAGVCIRLGASEAESQQLRVALPADEVDLLLVMEEAEQHIERARHVEKCKQQTHYSHIKKLCLEVKTPEEALDAAMLLSPFYGESKGHMEAIYELLLNAIEHGHLNVLGSYKNKQDLKIHEDYEARLKALLNAPENKDKSLKISYEELGSHKCLTISGDNFQSLDTKRLGEQFAAATKGRGLGLVKAHFMVETLGPNMMRVMN